MSTAEPKAKARPLVYAARTVEPHARRLVPGRCLEREVADAILAGNVDAGRDGGYVFGDTWVARVARVPGRLRARPRAWLGVGLEPRRR